MVVNSFPKVGRDAGAALALGLPKLTWLNSVEELASELDLITLGYRESLEDAHVQVFETGTVERSRSTSAEGAGRRHGKGGRIQEEARSRGAGELRRIGGRSRKRIADAIGTAGMAAAGRAGIGSAHAEGQAALQGENAVELPSSNQPAGHRVVIQNQASLADRQSVQSVGDKAVCDVERRETAFEAVIVGVGRRRTARQIVHKIGEILAVRVADSVGQSFREATFQRDQQAVVVGVPVVRRQFQERVAARASVVHVGAEIRVRKLP